MPKTQHETIRTRNERIKELCSRFGRHRAWTLCLWRVNVLLLGAHVCDKLSDI